MVHIEFVTGPVTIETFSAEDHEQLQTHLSDYKSLFLRSDTAMFVLAPDGSYLDSNEACNKLFGYAPESFKLGFVPSLISTEFQPDGKPSREKARNMLAIAEKRGKHTFEWLHKAQDGREFLSHVTLERIPFNGMSAIAASIRD